MKKGKKILSLLLMITIVFSVVGCEKASNKDNRSYSSEEINIPEEITYALDFRKCNDGTFVLIGTTQENKLLYFESKNLNGRWKKTEITLPIEANCITQVNVSKISKDKEIFVSYNVYNKDQWEKLDKGDEGSSTSLENKYAIVDKDKNVIDLQLDYLNERDEKGFLKYCNFLFEENIIAMSRENRVLVINKDNGRIESDFRVKGQYILNGLILEDSIVVVTESKVKRYDLETGKDLGGIQILNDKKLASEIVYITRGKSKDILQYVTRDGLYKCNEKEGKVTKIIDFNNSGGNLRTLEEVKSNEYVALYDNYSSDGTIEATLIRYKSDERKKKSPKDIVIYGLYETDVVKNAIAKYKKNHPELNIKFKFGIDSEKDVTISDAIKVLNAEMAAGKGPDILILDGLPADDYIKENLLEDIGDIIEEYTDNKELIGSIKDAYTKEDGIYEFPMYFYIPMMVGEEGVIKDINNLSSLADTLEKMDKKAISTSRYGLIDRITLFEETQKEMLVDKENIDEKKLRRYFEDSKKIYDICNNAEDEDMEDTIDEEYIKILCSSYFDITDYLISDSYNLGISLITGIESFADVYSLQEIKEDISYKFLEDNDVFIPNTIIGINSNSKNKDEARKIIKELLSKRCQTEGLVYVGGLPTNRLLLEKLKSESKDGEEVSCSIVDEQIEYKIKWPSKGEFEILDKKIETLKKPIEVNKNLFLALIISNHKYCNNEISLDEAVSYVIDNAYLDLAE